MGTSHWRSEIRLTSDINTVSQEVGAEIASPERPFVMVVLGDFRGLTDEPPSDRAGPLGQRPLLDINRDNFDTVLSAMTPSWQAILHGLPGQPQTGMAVQLRFSTLEDFSPDRIVAQLPPLQALFTTRQALNDPCQFDAAAASVRQRIRQSPATLLPTPEATTPSTPDVNPAELLDRILEESQPQTETSTEPWSEDLREFLEQIVRPHLVQIDTTQQEALIDAVDHALSQQVSYILHHPDFQRLEAAWRSLHWLVYTAETGINMKIRLLQVTKDELLQDLTGSSALETSELARLLREPSTIPGTPAASLLIGNFAFDHCLEDLALLERFGGIAARLQAPFVAAASPSLLGCEAFTDLSSTTGVAQQWRHPAYEHWHTLRQLPQARWLALALPRVLLRLPYGVRTNPARTFSFEEQVTGDGHDALLWGNPAFAVAIVVARAFAMAGWSFDLTRSIPRLEGLPLFVYDDAGTTRVKPCAEVLLSEPLVTELGEAGLIPLVSYHQADVVALPDVQALAHPRSPLRWIP